MLSTTTTTTSPPQPQTCAHGHRTKLIIPTAEGGSICLICLSNLLSNPSSPTVHVSFALSQLSHALSQPQFLHALLTLHPHFLVSPLVAVLSNLDDEAIAKQATDLVISLCDASDVRAEFVARVSDCLSSGSLAWSRRQLYMLHCFGILLDNQDCNLSSCIRNKEALIFNLITGLQLSSDEIQGEIMFVFYKSSLLQFTCMDENCTDALLAYCPMLLQISLDVLMKSQSDEVRLNCVAFLTVLAQKGLLQTACSYLNRDSLEADNFMGLTEDGSPLEVLFAEAVKGPLLSSDIQVQIATLDLIFLYLSSEDVSEKELQVLIEENVADYVFEILRLSGCKDSIVNSSIRVLDILSTAEQAFRQRVAVAFSTLVPILRYVAEVPFHPVQYQLLKLMSNCVTNCPGIISTSNIEEISSTLARMFKHINSEVGMLPETFNISCSVFVDLMIWSSSRGNSSLAASVKDAATSVSAFLNSNHANADQILHSLCLLKEAYAYDQEDNFPCSTDVGLRVSIIDILKLQILPWFMTAVNDMDEETVALGVIETFHSIMLQDSNVCTKNFVDCLLSSSWFSALFGCLGMFPSEKMKWRVYLIFSSIVDAILGSESGHSIRDAAFNLPSDPIDLLFLLGQRNSHNPELFSCHSAVLVLLYVSSLYNDRIADDKLVLASLEQFILLNSSLFVSGSSPVTIELLVNLYGLFRGFAKMSYQIAYSREAERILFQLLVENEWDSLSTMIHMTSLRWLFQQEKLCKPLSDQILKFCRCNSSIGNVVIPDHPSCQTVDLQVFAELVTAGDNFGAMIFMWLLADLVENACQEYDIISVLKACTEIIEIAPNASDQFCIHGVDSVLQNIYNHSTHTSLELFTSTSQLVFSILKTVHSELISNGEAWVGITLKVQAFCCSSQVQLVDYLIRAVDSDGWSEEILTIIGVLSLILHHSTNEVLTEASKTIMLSAHLVSTFDITISEACAKGPALFEHDEGTRTGEVLIFLLSLLFFSLRSARAILPGIMDMEILLDDGPNEQPLSYLSIRCHDLCKLMHFGSSPVKLVASCCLVELFTAISDYTNRETTKLKFRQGYLLSISSVLEGMISFSDIRVAVNCSRSLSTLTTWKQLEFESLAFEREHWCRLIVEELVMSLSTPNLVSESFMIHHKPAINVTVALLELSKVPSWLTEAFDGSSTQCVVQNISPSNVNTELVRLFRLLLDSGLLKHAQVAELNRVFQACRRHIYADEIEDSSIEEHMEKIPSLDHVGKIRNFLLSLVSSQSDAECHQSRTLSRRKELLDEIELFTKCSMQEVEA